MPGPDSRISECRSPHSQGREGRRCRYYCYYCNTEAPRGIVYFSDASEPICARCGHSGFVEQLPPCHQSDNGVQTDGRCTENWRAVTGQEAEETMLPPLCLALFHHQEVETPSSSSRRRADAGSDSNHGPSETPTSREERAPVPASPAANPILGRSVGPGPLPALSLSRLLSQPSRSVVTGPSTRMGRGGGTRFRLVIDGDQTRFQEATTRDSLGGSSPNRSVVSALIPSPFSSLASGNGAAASHPAEAHVLVFDSSRGGALSALNQLGAITESVVVEARFGDTVQEHLEGLNPIDFVALGNFLQDHLDPTQFLSEPRPAWMPAIEDLPKRVLPEGIVSAGECVICQEDFQPGDCVMSLSVDAAQCPHIFHASCIIPWLNERNSCPVCRFELPVDCEEYEQRKRELRESQATVDAMAHEDECNRLSADGDVPTSSGIPGALAPHPLAVLVSSAQPTSPTSAPAAHVSGVASSSSSSATSVLS